MSGTRGPIGFAEALSIVEREAAARLRPIERRPLLDCLGRALAQPLAAPIALPGFANSAMDGFAVRHTDLAADGTTRLRIQDEQFAGRDRQLHLRPRQAIRITTGAPMPAGADTVVIKEHTRIEGEQVLIESAPSAGANLRHAGEDIAVGEIALAAATRLGPAQVSLAAALGVDALPVHARPRVTVFSTGDELLQPGAALVPGCIYDSNHTLLQALLASCGVIAESGGALPDDADVVRARLRAAATTNDLLITCGGVSAGERDLLPAIIAELGEVFFWKVRIKPGMPVLFGRIGDCLIFALPGNPVAVLATFQTLTVPALDLLQGALAERRRVYARLRAPLRKTHARTEFMRARVECDETGVLWAEVDPATGSHMLARAARANALLAIDEGPQALDAGHPLPVWLLAGIG